MKQAVSAQDLAKLALGAGLSERGRVHLNTHETNAANVQRLFIATTPGTYIQPHRHSNAHKWEFFVLLEGSMDLLLFNNDGSLRHRSRLSRSANRAIEVAPGTWHSYVCLEPGTVALEVKEGAYVPTPAADLAPWAPAEQSPRCVAFLAWMRAAAIGDLPDPSLSS